MMDRQLFLDRQAELRTKLSHAVPRSGRAKKLRAELAALVVGQLRDEIGPAAPAGPLPEPPADFHRRVGDTAPVRAAAAPYGGRTPYWVDR